jgi:hypothetical protein
MKFRSEESFECPGKWIDISDPAEPRFLVGTLYNIFETRFLRQLQTRRF